MSVKGLAKFWLATAKDLKDVIIREKAVQVCVFESFLSLDSMQISF